MQTAKQPKRLVSNEQLQSIFLKSPSVHYNLHQKAMLKKEKILSHFKLP